MSLARWARSVEAVQGAVRQTCRDDACGIVHGRIVAHDGDVVPHRRFLDGVRSGVVSPFRGVSRLIVALYLVLRRASENTIFPSVFGRLVSERDVSTSRSEDGMRYRSRASDFSSQGRQPHHSSRRVRVDFFCGERFVSGVRVLQRPQNLPARTAWLTADGLTINQLWVAKDLVTTQSSPQDRRHRVSISADNGGPLPSCPTIGTTETPGHLKYARCVNDPLNAKVRWPRQRIASLHESIARRIEDTGCRTEHLTLIFR